MISSILKRIPGVMVLYARVVYPFVLAPDKRRYRVARWVSCATRFIARNGLAEITFAKDGVWVRDETGAEWCYINELYGGIHGLEFGFRHEEHELQFLLDNVEPASVVLDIGANIGFYSIRLARAVPEIQVFAFEPVSTTNSYLNKNIIRNRLQGSVHPFRLAVGDSDGACLVTSEKRTGNHIVGSTRGKEYHSRCETVPQITIDSFVAQQDLPRLDWIKCDVEGAELLVLRGAQATLRRFRPVLLLEIDEQWTARYGYQASEIFDVLGSLGYTRYHRFTHDGQVLPGRWSIPDELSDGHNFCFEHAGKE